VIPSQARHSRVTSLRKTIEPAGGTLAGPSSAMWRVIRRRSDWEHRLHPGPKGNEVDLPSQTMITVRMDNTVTLPRITADNGAFTGRADAQ